MKIKQSRRDVLKKGLGTGLAAATGALRGAGGGTEADGPNILLIMTEDQGAQLGCMGTAGLDTPHIDSLARQGTLFERATCVNPVCSPAKTGMMTGAHSHSNCTVRNVFEHFGPEPPKEWKEKRLPNNRHFMVPDEMPTLVEVLRGAGYRTALTRKFHMTPHHKFPFHDWIKNPTPERLQRFFSDSGNRPFFLFHNIGDPHRPFRPHARSEDVSFIDPSEVDVPDYLPDTEPVRRDWADYLTTIKSADVKVGRALRALREAGEYENTLIIFTSDHGPAYHRAKKSLYYFGLRVPFIAAGPGCRTGARTDTLISHVDLMPTCLDAAGAHIPDTVQGRSLDGLLAGRADHRERPVVFAEVHWPPWGPGQDYCQGRAVLRGRYHYIRRIHTDRRHPPNADLMQEKQWGNDVYPYIVENKDRFPEAYRFVRQVSGPTLPREQLYDIRRDPWEMNDLSEEEGHADALRRMRDVLRRWTRRTGDTHFHRTAFGG